MEALFLLIPISVILIFIAIFLFLHASEKGQFDDLDTPAWRILYDDDQGTHTKKNDTT